MAGSTGGGRPTRSTARSAPCSRGPVRGPRWMRSACTFERRARSPGSATSPSVRSCRAIGPRSPAARAPSLLEVVQPAGRPAMPADAWRRGLPRDHVLLGAAPPVEEGGRSPPTDVLPRLHRPRIEPSPTLGYTRHAPKEVADNNDGLLHVHPAGDAAEHRHHRLGCVARTLDLCQVGEGGLRHQHVGLRLRSPAARPPGPDRCPHRAGARPADRSLRPAWQGAARQQRRLRTAAAGQLRCAAGGPRRARWPAPLGGRRGRHRARGGPRAPGSRARSMDDGAADDRAGRSVRQRHRSVADHPGRAGPTRWAWPGSASSPSAQRSSSPS